MTDRRFLAANERVAHAALEGQVEAPRFAEGELFRCARPWADLCASPGGKRDKQILFGQGVRVLEVHDGWAFGIDAVDDYVGYLPAGALVPNVWPTHRVSSRLTHVYSRHDLKSPEQMSLSYFSELAVIGQEGRFCALAGGGFVPEQHVEPLSWYADDPVVEAEKFLGTPYLWGGNSGTGIDCSGLVQLALYAVGRACPRDSDLQQVSLGQTLPPGTPVQRGDLLFWKGHVAMAVDDETMIHANGHHMAVAYENIAEAIARIKAQGEGGLTAHKRL